MIDASGCGRRSSEAVRADVLAVEITPLAVEERPQRRTVSRIRAREPVHGRSCQPLTIAGLDAPSATSTGRPVRVATDADAERDRDRAADADRAAARPSGRTRSVRRPIAVASANASNEAISPTHTVSIPA